MKTEQFHTDNEREAMSHPNLPRMEKARGKKRGPWFLLDIGVVVLMCGVLFYGISEYLFYGNADAGKYQCYAIAFIHNLPTALQPKYYDQCKFITRPVTADYLDYVPPNQHIPTILEHLERYGLPASFVNTIQSWQSPDTRFHSLPKEYPFLVLLPFLVPLLVPGAWYQVAFACLMALLAVGIYYLILRTRTRGSAIAFATYLAVGGYATALGRFDLIPALLTLLAVLYADRRRWNWAYVYLALATLFKFYPVILLIPFLIEQQRHMQGSWKSRQRWIPLGIFTGLCSVVMLLSLALSVEGTLRPFTYFLNRPIQVESLQATFVVYVSRHITHSGLYYRANYGSFNVFGGPQKIISLSSTLLLLVGLAATYWLQWKRKIDLAVSSLLTLLVIIITGKVFSPQYLIWVAPLVAYVGLAKWRWLIPWTLLSLLTTIIFPYVYQMRHLHDLPGLWIFFPSIAFRNFVFLAIVLTMFYVAVRKGLTASIKNDAKSAGLTHSVEVKTSSISGD